METEAAPAPASTETAAGIEAPEKTWEVKYRDKTHKLNENELLKRASLGFGSDERFQEAARMRDEWEPKIRGLSSKDQKERMRALKGVVTNKDDLLGMAETLLMEELEYNQLSESEQENLKLKDKLTGFEEREKEVQEESNSRKKQEMLGHAQKEINDEISAVLKTYGSKPTPRLVKRIAEEMLAHLDSKGGRMKASDAMSRAVSGMETDISEYLSNLPVNKLKEVLPKQVLNALRKANIDQVSTMSGNRVGKKSGTQTRPQKSRKMSSDDFFSRMENKFK